MEYEQGCGQSQRALVMLEWETFLNIGRELAKGEMLLILHTVTSRSIILSSYNMCVYITILI